MRNKIRRKIRQGLQGVKDSYYRGYFRMQGCIRNEEGITVVEIILVLVVLIGLVLIFKSQLTELIDDIFETITSESSTV